MQINRIGRYDWEISLSWRTKIYFKPTWWVWPYTAFRMNSSFMWGCNPYKSYNAGPFELRRYQT